MSPIGYPGGACTGKVRVNDLNSGLSGLIKDMVETVRPSKVRKANR